MAFGAFMGSSSLGSDGGSDARGRTAPSWLPTERHGAPVRSHQITDRTNTNAHFASESIALPVMKPAHYVRRPAMFPIALPFFKLDVAPIVQIAHADWLQSLRELLPHLSGLFLSCVFSIIFLVGLLLVALSFGRNHNLRIP